MVFEFFMHLSTSKCVFIRLFIEFPVKCKDGHPWLLDCQDKEKRLQMNKLPDAHDIKNGDLHLPIWRGGQWPHQMEKYTLSLFGWY